MTRWEYATVNMSTQGIFTVKMNEEKVSATLNQFGSDGWELVSAVSIEGNSGQSSGCMFVFKRPLAG